MNPIMRGKNRLKSEIGSDIKCVCQYTTMMNIGRELNRKEKLYQFLLRAYPAIKRRIRKYINRSVKEKDKKLDMDVNISNCKSEDDSRDMIKQGDIVQVIAHDQIKLTLNDRGCFKGLSFQENMEKYCNNTYKVLKIPQTILDQGGKKINRCKDVVILKGLYCNGKGTILEEGCDRCCLHYWKADWLKKV